MAIPSFPSPGFPSPGFPSPAFPPGPPWREQEVELVPEVHRFSVTSTEFVKLIDVRSVRKFAVIADVTNAVVVRIAGRKLSTDNTTEYQDFQPGDSILWESTRAGESLSMDVWARVASGTAIVYVWEWTVQKKEKD